MSRTFVVTGAGSGIGAVLARRLLGRGDRLVLIARDAARGDALRAELPGSSVIVVDLADPDALAGAVAAADLPDAVDGIVHAAGIVELGTVEELPVSAWTAQLAVNLVAPAELTRLLLPRVRAARGQVLFVNSGAGLTAHPEWSAYAASKHGLRALADALRGEESSHGVRVTSVYPGRTATPMQEKVHAQEGAAYDPSRFIDAESVAAVVLAALDATPDATLTDITVRPGPR